mmetsp:Transcript_32096/g.66437  ORF Transcript_32096/g.66437 Transcript_32096/m.66437 type:complete len:259 (+) Transcript_32096:1143-1919(+)
MNAMPSRICFAMHASTFSGIAPEIFNTSFSEPPVIYSSATDIVPSWKKAPWKRIRPAWRESHIMITSCIICLRFSSSKTLITFKAITSLLLFLNALRTNPLEPLPITSMFSKSAWLSSYRTSSVQFARFALVVLREPVLGQLGGDAASTAADLAEWMVVPAWLMCSKPSLKEPLSLRFTPLASSVGTIESIPSATPLFERFDIHAFSSWFPSHTADFSISKADKTISENQERLYQPLAEMRPIRTNTEDFPVCKFRFR